MAGLTGQQEADVRSFGRQSIRRIDRSEQVGDRVGKNVDPGSQLQHESTLFEEVELAGERGAVVWNIELQRSQLDVAQTEAAGVEQWIERLHDAQFLDRRIGIGWVGDVDQIGQGSVRRDDAVGTDATGACHFDLVTCLSCRVEEVAEVGIIRCDGRYQFRFADADLEAHKVGRAGEAEVVIVKGWDGATIDRWVVPQPLADFVEELHQPGGSGVAVIDDGIAGRPCQESCRHTGGDAVGIGAQLDCRRNVFGPQQSSVTQRLQIERTPVVGIGGKCFQRLQNAQRTACLDFGIAQHRQSQRFGFIQSEGDVFLSGHRRGCREDPHVERHGFQFAGKQGIEELGIQFERLAQAREYIDHQREGCCAANDEVLRETSGGEDAIEVEIRIEGGPVDPFDAWFTTQIRRDDERLQQAFIVAVFAIVDALDDIESRNDAGIAVRNLRNSEHDVGVRDIEVALVGHGDTKDADFAKAELARAADADVDIQWRGRLDQQAVRIHGDGTIGIGHLDVVEAIGSRAQVEGGNDPGGINHFKAHRQEFAKGRPDQLGRGVVGKFGTANGDGGIAIVADGIGRYVSDRERQELRGQREWRGADGRWLAFSCCRIGFETIDVAHQDVIGASLSAWNDRTLVAFQEALEPSLRID